MNDAHRAGANRLQKNKHAAALGTFGFVFSHNLATRWARHNFDTYACFVSCNNIGDVSENCVTLQL